MNRAHAQTQLLQLMLGVCASLAWGAAAWQVLAPGMAGMHKMALDEAGRWVPKPWCFRSRISCQQGLQLLMLSSGGVADTGLCC